MPLLSHLSNRIRITLPILSRETKLSCLSLRRYSHQYPANIVGNPQDFFRYTSGRWVWDEKQQLEERYREFNILELQKVAMEVTSSGSWVRMEKLTDGMFNKSFKLTMGNGKVVVVRIPNPNAGPAFLTTASEVATLDLVSGITINHFIDIYLRNQYIGELTWALAKKYTSPSSPRSFYMESYSWFNKPCWGWVYYYGASSR